MRTLRVCTEEEVGYVSLKFSGQAELYVFVRMGEMNVGTGIPQWIPMARQCSAIHLMARNLHR